MNIVTQGGAGTAVSSGGDPLVTKLWVRTHVRRGAWFMDPNLGHEFFRVKRVSDAGVRLLRELALRAVDGLVGTWLRSIDCRAEVGAVPGRVDIHYVGVRSDGREITFDTFYKVV